MPDRADRSNRRDPRDGREHAAQDSDQSHDIAQDVHKTWGPADAEERAERAWRAARGWDAPVPILGPDSAYAGVRELTAAEYVGAWEQRERETREARLRAASIRARAEERRRAIYAAMDTGPLILMWPHPTPEPFQAIGPDAILLTHPQEPDVPFRLHERVSYRNAFTTLRGDVRRIRHFGKVEGWRRFSTGYKIIVRWCYTNPTTHALAWEAEPTAVWEGYLRSMETRVLPRRKRDTAKLPPPNTHTKP